MTKQETRAQLSIFLFKELKSLLSIDPELQVITVKIILVENPDYGKAGIFTIQITQNKS